MADSWEDDDFAPPPIPKPVGAFADEDVKDNWEDIDTTPASEQQVPEPSVAPKEPKKPKKDKIKTKVAQDAVNVVNEKKLTPQELEEIQRKADFNIAKETFGFTEEPCPSFAGEGPATKEDFTAYNKFLVNEIQKHKNQSEYYDFLSELFKELCVNLESEHVRRYGKEISALGAALHQTEKEAEKAKQKSKKKPTVNVSRNKIDDLEDYVGGGAFDEVDDDDFM